MFRKLFLSLFIFPLFLSAQDADTMQLVRSVTLNYDNDVFTQSDCYYTQGIFLNMNLPILRKNPISKILMRLPKGHRESFGISYNNTSYTPTSIKSDSVLVGDRPFAGTIYFGLNRVTCNSDKKIRLFTELDLGWIGPAAMGYQIQRDIHKWTNNPTPHGWDNQIRNDVIINYTIKLEKGLLTKKIIDIVGYGIVNGGLMFNDAGLGMTTKIGIKNPYFDLPGFSKKFQCWIFGNAEDRIIARNGTLQGGFLDTKSVYIIIPEYMKRSVYSISAGIVFAYEKVHVNLSETFISPEFRNASSHQWGRIGVEVMF